MEAVRDATTDHALALVEWRDAWFDLEQEGPEDCRADYLVRTVGFLVREGPRFVSLAQEILPDGEGLRAVTHIPLAIVERMVRLEPIGRDHRPDGRTAPRLRVDCTGPRSSTRTTIRKEGCTMAETALAVPPHPSGIGR